MEQWNLKGLKVVGTDANEIRNALLAILRGVLSLDREVAREVVKLWWQTVAYGSGAHSRQVLRLFDESRVEVAGLRRLHITLTAQQKLHREHAIGIHAEIHMLQAPQTLDQQP